MMDSRVIYPVKGENMISQWKWAVRIEPYLYQSPDEIIELCKYASIQALETHPGFVEGKTENQIIEIGKYYTNAGIQIYTFHLPFSQEEDIASFYETKRKEAVKRITGSMERAYFLGASTVILHPTTSHFDVRDEGFEKYLVQMGKTIEQLLPVAEKLNLNIAIENMLPGTGERFGSKPAHFKFFSEKFEHEKFGFCLDTGHAFVSCGYDGPFLFFDMMKDRIFAFHIQDNPGDRDLHIPPGRGLINWNKFFKKIAEHNFSFPLCIEALPFEPAECGKYSNDAWKNMVDQVNKLAVNALEK